MSQLFRRILVAVCLAAVGATGLSAATPPVAIDSAHADTGTGLLTIAGSNFGTTAPTVVLDGFVLAIQSSGPSQIIAVLPASALADPGDYAVTVTRNAGNQSSTASFIVTVGAAGAQGPAGPAGTAGAVGPTGPAGANGAAGAAGATGANGATGAVGPTGPAGANGAAGAAGPTGAAGANGATGPTGAQGPAGANGSTGPQGPQGAQGAQGVQGPAGATGPAGANGAAGPIGPTGPQGPAGVGLSGPTGPTGPAGATGAAGAADALFKNVAATNFVALGTSPVTIGSVGFTAPSAGIVYAIATGYCNMGANTTMYVLFDTQPNVMNASAQAFPYLAIIQNPNAFFVQGPFVSSRAFSVNSGQNTIYLNGQVTSGTAADNNCQANLTAFFTPTALP
jgi:hypothetical protein